MRRTGESSLLVSIVRSMATRVVLTLKGAILGTKATRLVHPTKHLVTPVLAAEDPLPVPTTLMPWDRTLPKE